jgi:hypothetical protein
MCEDSHEIALGWGPGHIWLHTTLEGPWPHYMILEVHWNGLCTLSFGLAQFHYHGSWLVCEVTLKATSHKRLTTLGLFYFIMCEDPHEIAFGWGLITYDSTLHLRIHDHTLWFRRCVGTAFGCGLLGSHKFHGHGSWPLTSPKLHDHKRDACHLQLGIRQLAQWRRKKRVMCK